MTVRGCRLVARELDQVAPVQEIFEQRFFIFRKWRRLRQGGQKFHRRLPRYRQRILIRHIATQDIGNLNAELIWICRFDFARNEFQFFERSFSRQFRGLLRFLSAREKPNDQADETESDKAREENCPRRDE